jgi:hypothetical protein
MRNHSTDSDVSVLIEYIEHFASKCKSACVAYADIKEHSAKSDVSA